MLELSVLGDRSVSVVSDAVHVLVTVNVSCRLFAWIRMLSASPLLAEPSFTPMGTQNNSSYPCRCLSKKSKSRLFLENHIPYQLVGQLPALLFTKTNNSARRPHVVMSLKAKGSKAS